MSFFWIVCTTVVVAGVLIGVTVAWVIGELAKYDEHDGNGNYPGS